MHQCMYSVVHVVQCGMHASTSLSTSCFPYEFAYTSGEYNDAHYTEVDIYVCPVYKQMCQEQHPRWNR